MINCNHYVEYIYITYHCTIQPSVEEHDTNHVHLLLTPEKESSVELLMKSLR